MTVVRNANRTIMDLGLKGKIALVAGASQGLGRAIALELAQEGCIVSICALDDPHLQQTLSELQCITQASSFACDLSSSNACASFVQHALELHGRVDILVCNAGGPRSGSFSDFDNDDWDKAFRLNLLSTVAMTRAAVPNMIQHGWGRLINITSASVKQPIDGLMLSNSIRLGVIGFAKTLSRELAPHGITVNNVCPGYTRTDRVVRLAASTAASSGKDETEIYAAWQNDIPMGRLGEPEELAALVTFLASSRASYITGTSIQVDGGFVRGVC